MKVLLVSATTNEIAETIQHLESHWQQKSFSEFVKKNVHIFPLVTGVGSMMTAFALARFTAISEIQLAIHAGISGAYRQDFKLTEVVEIISEEWADLGAENINGEFIDCFELGLMDKNRFPYYDGKLLKKKLILSTGLQSASGLTVNKTSGSERSIHLLKQKYNADTESMEGAGFFYACSIMDIPFVSIRSVSNYIEPRNRSKWKIEEAITALNNKLIEVIENL